MIFLRLNIDREWQIQASESPAGPWIPVANVLLTDENGTFLDTNLKSDHCFYRALTGSSSGLSEGLVAHYPFNGNANDESGNGLHGQNQGATLAEDRFGNPGSAYFFDGVNDEIVVPHDSLLNPQNEWSICLWFKAEGAVEGNEALLFKGWNNNPQTGLYFNRAYSLWVDSASMAYLSFGNANTGKSISYFHTVEPTEWVFYSTSLDRENQTINYYINGEKVHTQDPGPFTFSQNTEDLLIGNTAESVPWEGRFHGWIDDLRIYNRTLNGDEVRELYDLGH